MRDDRSAFYSVLVTGLGNADAGVKKELLTFVTVRYAQYEELGTIWTAELDGSSRRRLTAGNVPDISPDGRWVAFVNRANQLQVIVSFSRDGRWVLAWDNGQLVQIPWAGGEPRVLARGVDESADWTR